MEVTLSTDEWAGCYEEGWKGMIVDEAFAHPAKMSYSLAARIYDHAFKSGWLKPGDTVVDPFGGIGGTALHAAIQGVRWLGCELEPKFHALANQNFDLWQRNYGHYPEWVRPTMYLGDSRNLCKVVGLVDACVSSPPFTASIAGEPRRPELAGVLSQQQRGENNTRGGQFGKSLGADYGSSPGQLGSMKEGNIDVVLSSPPYAESIKGSHGERETAQESRDKRSDYSAGGSLGRSQRHGGYGVTDGQLGSMPEGDVGAVVGSPPYAEGLGHGDGRVDHPLYAEKNLRHIACEQYGDSPGQLGAMVVGSPPFESTEVRTGETKGFHSYDQNESKNRSKQDYISQTAEGSLGNQSGETFWQAARDIVIQCHAILRPGGVAIWVCKDFVRAKKRVPFSDQWLALCESIGFKLVCRHQASLVKRGDTQKDIFGGEETRQTERKSFFRRLAEKKGSPRIDWEDVICVQRVYRS